MDWSYEIRGMLDLPGGSLTFLIPASGRCELSLRRRITWLPASLLFVVVVGVAPPVGAAVPAGFSDELVAGSLGQPTAFDFTPDGRMLVTTQPGQVRVYEGGQFVQTALNLGTTGTDVLCFNSERGILGIAVDPQFATNGHVYLYYTFDKNNAGCLFSNATTPVNRVSRWTMTGNTLGSEFILIDNIPSYNGNHNAGDVQFGKDGHLYVSVGDGGCNYEGVTHPCAGSNNAARSRHHLLGKIVRIAKDGTIPPGNPYMGAGTARCNFGATTPGTICQETFSWGLRNPFRIAFDPNQPVNTVFHINDVGQGAWEEIDRGQAAADYGWNVREGFCVNGSTTNCGPPPVGMTNPIHAYGRSEGCVSITGGAFVPNGIWPSAYDNNYMFQDYGCGRMFRLVPDGSGGFDELDFASGLGSVVHMRFGPWGSSKGLYYTTYSNGGQVRRIVHTASNNVPTADVSASPTSGPAPLTVTFNGGGSSDPDGDTLTYQWTFGDTQSQNTTTPTVMHTYGSNGTYTASLRVLDSRGALSPPDSVTITVGGANTPPSPTIASPASGATFAVGQTITLTGSATDAQQGTLPDSSLTWTVLRHHELHTHPWFGPTAGNNLTFQAPAPEDLSATTNSYLEVILTATDSGGLSSTVARDVMPKTVAITFATNPAGRTVTVNGSALVGPATITSWQAWVLNVNVPRQAGWKFVSWSDGGAKAHAITTPASPTTYTATFTQGGGCGPPRC